MCENRATAANILETNAGLSAISNENSEIHDGSKLYDHLPHPAMTRIVTASRIGIAKSARRPHSNRRRNSADSDTGKRATRSHGVFADPGISVALELSWPAPKMLQESPAGSPHHLP